MWVEFHSKAHGVWWMRFHLLGDGLVRFKPVPLLLWVHITNAKVVLLQQTVVVADVVNKKLPFGLPL